MSDVPSLANIIQYAITDALSGINTCIPAQVISFDAAANTISAQPVISRRYYADDQVVPLPPIHGVPVCFPRSGNAFISFPLAAGDGVLLLFSQRSIDAWYASGTVGPADDPRQFDLTDAIAIPGAFPQTSPIAADTTALRIQNGNARLDILPTGQFKFGKTGGDDFLDLLSQTLDALNQARVNTMLGVMPLINTATYAALKSKVDALKG